MPAASPIVCIVVDRSRLVADALRDLLVAEGFDVVGLAATGAAVLEHRGRPGIVFVLHQGLPDVRGLDVAAQLLGDDPQAAVILHATSLSPSGVERALAMGVRGIVLKETAGATIADAVRIVASGGTYVDPQLVR